MTKITKLDKAALVALRDPINAKLKELADQLGLSMVLANGSFGDGAEASFKLVLKVEDAETKMAAAKANWDRNCHYIGKDWSNPDNSGLRPEDFGTTFSYAGGKYRTTGIATRGRGSQKFPILCEVVEAGKTSKVGEVRMLPEAAAKMIRAATDAAKPAAAPAKAKAKKAA